MKHQDFVFELYRRKQHISTRLMDIDDQQTFIGEFDQQLHTLRAFILNQTGEMTWYKALEELGIAVIGHVVTKEWKDAAQHLVGHMTAIQQHQQHKVGAAGMEDVQSVEMFDALLPLMDVSQQSCMPPLLFTKRARNAISHGLVDNAVILAQRANDLELLEMVNFAANVFTQQEVLAALYPYVLERNQIHSALKNLSQSNTLKEFQDNIHLGVQIKTAETQKHEIGAELGIDDDSAPSRDPSRSKRKM